MSIRVKGFRNQYKNLPIFVIYYLAEELVVPTFDDGSTPPEVNIDEDSSIGSNVVTFKAFGDLNEAVKYAVAGGNIGKVFDVDSLTGIVYVNQTLDYETHDR